MDSLFLFGYIGKVVYLSMSQRVIFKEYNQHQPILFPPSYDELIPRNHLVRIVNTIIDNIDISSLEKQYKGGGTSLLPKNVIESLCL